MEEKLKFLQQVIDELNSSNSSNQKLEILSKYKDNEFLKKVLEYTYSPYKQFGVTSDNCIKLSNLPAFDIYEDLFSLLDDLVDRNITGHDAIRCINTYINKYPKYKNLIYNIIDKNLKIRIGETSINKIIPNCIPTFDVALAHEYEDKRFKEGETWFASRKMDGVRCIIIVDENGNAIAYSRNGLQFTTLNKLLKEVESFGLRNAVYDG